jgi:hypothetical protein
VKQEKGLRARDARNARRPPRRIVDERGAQDLSIAEKLPADFFTPAKLAQAVE